MSMSGVISKDRLTSGLLVAAVASGLTFASLSTTTPANAWCVSVSGLPGIGSTAGNCSSGLFGLSLGLGDTSQAHSEALTIAVAAGDSIADAAGVLTGAIASGGGQVFTNGFLTAGWAGGTGSLAVTHGLVAWAMSQSVKGAGPLIAQAGINDSGDFGNFAFNFGNAEGVFSHVLTGGGGLNLAANLGGNANNGVPIEISAVNGWGNTAINLIGNRNHLFAGDGFLNMAASGGNPLKFPQGSDSSVTATGNLSAALNYQGLFTTTCDSACGNVVIAEGPLAYAAALYVVKETVPQVKPGININNIIKIATPLAAQAASATPTSLAASTGSDTGGGTTTVTAPKASSPKSVSKSVTKSTSKSSGAVSKVTSKHAGKA